MANTFKNAISQASIGTVSTAVYTTPAATTTTIIGLSVANVVTSTISVGITLTDTSASKTVYIVKNLQIMAGTSAVVVGGEQKLVMETGDILQVVSDTASSVDVTVSLLQLT